MVASRPAFHTRLSTQLAIFLVVMMVTGMGVMEILVSTSKTPLGFLTGVVMAAVIAFPLALWGLHRILGPLWGFQVVARRLLARWDIQTEEHDDWSVLQDRLVQLTSLSEERIQALESERAQVGAVLDSMIEGVIALDQQGFVILMNPTARHILDLGQEVVEGQALLEVIRNRGLADVAELCQTLEPTEHCRREVELQLPVHRVLEVNAMPLPDSQGIVLVFHDISALRRLEHMRAEFVANVSHELRTPLTAMKGYLETLLDAPPAEPLTHRRFLEVAHAHADRFSRLIDDLLRLSDLETGKVILHSQTVGLRECVNDVSAIFEQEGRKKGITLQNEVSSHVEVWADRDRLSQIVVNLVDNALKYTPSGGTILFRSIEPDNGFLGLQVIDTGQGIPPSDLPRITERLYRADKARSRDMGGTGLGLTIVKHLVHLHGGTLHIDSKVGKGTSIQIGLPVPHR